MAQISKAEWYRKLLEFLPEGEARQITGFDPDQKEAQIFVLHVENEQTRIQRVNDAAWDKMKDAIGQNGRGVFC